MSERRSVAASRLLVVAVVHYLGARLSDVVHVPGTNVGLIWPPAGTDLAFMVLWGYRVWPAILVGQLAQDVTTWAKFASPAVGMAVLAIDCFADVIPTLLGAYWVRRGRGDDAALGRGAGLGRLLGLGGAAAQGVSAFVGIGAVLVTGVRSPALLGHIAIDWWLSNIVSVLVFVPLMIAWRPPLRMPRPIPEYVAFGAVAVVASALLFAWIDAPSRGYVIHLTVLLVVVAAFLLGRRGATATTAILATGAVIGIVSGKGAFPAGDVDRELLLLNFYVATLAITGLVVSSILEDRDTSAAATAETAALLEAVLQAVPLPISYATLAGRIEFWSPRGEELFGYRAEDVPTVERWFHAAYPDAAYRAATVARWEAALEAAKEAGSFIDAGEVDIVGKDGSVRNVHVLGAFAKGRIVVIFNDLTVRKRAEAQREHLREQLLHTQKMDSIGLLAGGVAHDLNNLLSPILGYSELLLATAAPKSATFDDLQEIKRAAERARDITRRLLAFGRKQVFDMRTVDLRDAMARMERLLHRAIREDVHIHLEMPETLGKVRADVAQIEQVLMNLAVNAQHAMAQGGDLYMVLEDVTIDGTGPGRDAAVPAGAWVLLTVRDTGSGMERSVLERAFEPFFTTKRAGEGTGLGLAVVDGIVSQHGGHLFAESEVGKGTTFRIYFPRFDDGPVDVAPEGGGATATPGGQETILLAEDEEGTRKIVVRMLRQLGYRVIEATDAGSSLRRAAEERGPIDLLLTDVVMPGTNGKELYEQLSKVRPAMRVLFMSGYSANVLTERGVLLEGMHLVAKPFSIEGLSAALRRVLHA